MKQLTIKKIKELENKSYNDVFSYLKKGELYMYSEKNPNTELFWNSTLPVKWANELYKEPYFTLFLQGYFSKEDNVNSDFLLKILKLAPDDLIKTIKLTKSYKLKKHWDSFVLFATNKNNGISVFFKQLKAIKNLEYKWEKKSKFYYKKLYETNYEDFFIHAVAYFEKYKRFNEKLRNNANEKVSIEMNFIYLINKLLNKKREHELSFKLKITNNYTPEEFKRKTKDTLPPLLPQESLKSGSYTDIENITKEKKEIRDLFRFFFSQYVFEHHLDLYFLEYADFIDIQEDKVVLRTNSKYLEYQINDKKNVPNEKYLANLAFQGKVQKEPENEEEIFKYEMNLHVSVCYEYFKFYRIVNNIDIDIYKIILLLKNFSWLLMPNGRWIFPNQVFIKGKPKYFKELFYSDYIACYKEKELVFNIEHYLDWEKEESQKYLDFLTTDLSNSNKIDILQRPIIKIGENYIWLSSFLRDRAWEILLHKKIILEKNIEHNKYATDLEKNLADDFKNAKINAISSLEYTLKKGNKNEERKGEIDVLAYKNNVLFIIEIKISYHDENLKHNEEYRIKKFELKAYEQLKQGVEYIQTHFDQLKSNIELGIDCDLADLQIQPLIVSNLFVADNTLINKEYIKISLLELKIILTNNLKDALTNNVFKGAMKKFVEKYEISRNSNSEIHKKHDINALSEKDFNLWENSNECTPNDIIKSITKRGVFKHLDDMYNYFNLELDLTEFNHELNLFDVD